MDVVTLLGTEGTDSWPGPCTDTHALSSPGQIYPEDVVFAESRTRGETVNIEYLFPRYSRSVAQSPLFFILKETESTTVQVDSGRGF